MRQENNYIAAIDIGTTKIVSIVGKLNENKKLEILGLNKTVSTGVKRGVVQNIEETVNAIRDSILEIQKQADVRFTDVYVGIAGQHIKSVKNRGYLNLGPNRDEITKTDIDALIADMHKIPIDLGEEIIHVLPQNYIVDHETGVKNPVGMSGRRLEANFHIVIGEIASAKNIEKCVNRVGLKVNQLILEPLASSAAVLTDDEKEAGVALVDIGGGTTDVAVYYDDVIRHTAVVPFGGNVVTQDIKEGCSILNRQAEALKTQFGSALGDLAPEDKVVTIPGISGREPKEISFKSLAYIIQSRMEEIIDAVMFEIENSGCIEKLSAGIVLTGGGAMLKHLAQLVKFRTGMDVRIGFPNEFLASSSLDDINHPMYSTSIGLLIKGLELEKSTPKTESVKEEPVQEDEFEEDIVDEKQNSGNFMDAIKRGFTNIFEEKGASMED
ncbi:MAG TPA: cell division protein FtsA [Bacteroidales bacterium]|jgi:cell division protein FtsA|nr:cell division protein FtsA [Bacteroidales bacterium]